MNILYSIDHNCLNLLFTSIYSLLENGGYQNYTIYIFHSDLSDENMRIIADFFNEVEMHFIEIPKDMFSDFPTIKRYPEQIYYRLAAPLLLPNEIERVLYLDVDTIVINSLKDLYEIDFESNLFVACTNTKNLLTKFNQFRLGIPITKSVPYVNTGVLLMNLKQLRKEYKFQDIYEYMKCKKEFLVLPDQDILTGLYGEKVKIIDSLKYNLSDRTIVLHNIRTPQQIIDINWVNENTVIIHYFGSNKPWRENYNGILGEFYFDVEKKLQNKIKLCKSLM